VSDIYVERELEAIAARWDAKARTWESELASPDCHLNEDAAYERFLAQARATIAARFAFCAKNGVIDAGCGTALVLEKTIGAFAWGIGVDLSPEMLRLARQKKIPRVSFALGDCFQLAALCPPAGTVLSRGVLLSHYGPAHGEALLSAAKACLVPGGFILFDFLNASARSRHAHDAENKTYFTAPEISSLAQRAGFKTAEILGEPERRVQMLLAE
jgi:SAM-dependent methyltransferase